MELFGRKQMVDTLIVLLEGKLNMLKIQRLLGGTSTYSNIVKNIKLMEGSGLIKSEKDGRSRMIELTERGELIARLLEQIKEQL